MSTNRPKATRRAFSIAAMGMAAAVDCLRAAEIQPIGELPFVELPPLMVEAKAAPLHWRYLELPGREFISVCDDDVSAAFVRRQFLLDKSLDLLLPGRFRVRLSTPEACILFTEKIGRARAQEVIADMVAKDGATVAPNGTVIFPGLPGGGPMGRRQAIRFLPNLRLNDSDMVRVFVIVSERTDAPMEFKYAKDRIAFLVSQRTPSLPDWFVEGLPACHALARCTDDEIQVQPLTWISAEETAAMARDPQRPRTLLPMEELFSLEHPGMGDEGSELGRVWQAQSALFVLWAVTDATGSRREALWRWLDLLDREPASEEGFRACFGIGYSDARDRLSDFLPIAVRDRAALPAPRIGSQPRIKFRAATDLEVARIRGSWERLQIAYVRNRFPALTGKYVEQARRTLQRADQHGERDARLLAELGLLEYDTGNRDGARDYLEAAAQMGVLRPRPYVELAKIRYQDLQGRGSQSKLTGGELQAILSPLLQARLGAPPLAEVYALLTEIWLLSETPPTPQDLVVVDEGARLFPRNTALLVRAIQLHANAGSFPAAAMLAETGARYARDPKIRERFRQARDELLAAAK